MYWTAHRVTQGTAEEVHVFVHEHGADFQWPADASRLPEEAPGALIHQRTGALIPGGNRVRSYLDVLAPDFLGDGLPSIELQRLIGSIDTQPNPTVWIGVGGQVTIRFGCEQALDAERSGEIRTLARAIGPELPVV